MKGAQSFHSTNLEPVFTLDELTTLFNAPPAEYRPMPLWNWDTNVTREAIDFDLKAFKEQGFGGVFIHPRRGMVQEYLSGEYMELWRHALEQGKSLGLFVWIYDENTYPAGFAGGLTQARMPSSYNQPQGLSMMVRRSWPDDAAAFDIVLREENGRFVKITDASDSVKGRDGTYYLFKKTFQPKLPKYNGFSWVDLLLNGVTETFIDITMKPHEAIAGRDFGQAVPGVFSDEPHVGPPHGSVRYSPVLFDAFKKRWGYDLETSLPCLFERTGNWQQVRHNYFQTLLEIYIERWSKPYQAYCRDKGLVWTGHYWEHTWPNIDLSIDDMALYEWHDMPGIDMLFNNFDDLLTDAQWGNVRAVKEVASVANQMGRKRVLCETYGGAGWELTFERMKRYGDWVFVLGVNFMNQHLSFMSLAGLPKYDHPPAFSHQEPWWPYYGTLADYYARLSVALSSGREVNRILVLEPNSTLWMYVKSGLVDALVGPQQSIKFPENDLLNERAMAFQAFVTELSRAQVEYDLGSEAVIRSQGRVDRAEFVVGECAYQTVVIAPGTENLNQSTFDLLKTYIGNGGKVLLYGHPHRRDGRVDPAVDALLDAGKSNVIAVDAGIPARQDRHLLDKDFGFNGLAGGYLLHQRRQLGHGQLLFLANASLTEPSTGSITCKGRDVAGMDLFTGVLSGYAHTADAGRIAIPFTLPPAGSLLLYVSESPLVGIKRTQPVKAVKPVPSKSPLTCRRASENVLPLHYCSLTINGQATPKQYVLDAATQAFKAHGFASGSPWRAIQFRRNIVEKNTFGPGTGFEAAYDFVIDGKVDLVTIRAVVEKPHIWTVRINGHEVEPEPGRHWLDRSFGVYAIGSFAAAGRNTLSLSVSPMSVHAEIEPVYILGDFSVTPAATGWVITPPQPLHPGSWQKQGLPFYPDAVVYSREFEIDSPSGNWVVALEGWAGSVAEVLVNGASAGTIFSQPYQCDVSRFVKPGVNRIDVKVIGTLRNTLGPFFTDTKGIAGPNKWETAPDTPRPEQYRLVDYGLFDTFQLYTDRSG